MVIFRDGDIRLIKTKPKEEICTVEGCEKKADVAFFTVIQHKEGTTLVRTPVTLEVCLEHYKEHFFLHLCLPLTEQGWTGLRKS